MQGWSSLGFACVYAALWLIDRRPGRMVAVVAVVFLISALLQAISRRWFYWDIDSTGLHQRHLWSKKEIGVAWDKVIIVRNFIPGLRWDGTVSVYYERPMSRNGFSYIVATPERRKEFIATIRRFAPQAKFEI